jgi:hypothetical protein
VKKLFNIQLMILLISATITLTQRTNAANSATNVSHLIAALVTINNADNAPEKLPANCPLCKGRCALAQHIFNTHFQSPIVDSYCAECACPESNTFCLHTEYSKYIFKNFCEKKHQCTMQNCNFVCPQHAQLLASEEDGEVTDNDDLVGYDEDAVLAQTTQKPNFASKKFFCHCGFTTSGQAYLTLHQKKHTREKSLQIKLFGCHEPTCGKVFTSTVKRQRHMHAHNTTLDKSPHHLRTKTLKKDAKSACVELEDLDCALCPYKTSNQDCLDYHVKFHPTYTCIHDGCNFTTTNHYEMTWHLNARGQFVCKYPIDVNTCCNQAFYTQKLFKEHQSEHNHFIEVDQSEDQSHQETTPKIKNTVREEVEKPFKCGHPGCTASFMGPKWLENHQIKNSLFLAPPGETP